MTYIIDLQRLWEGVDPPLEKRGKKVKHRSFSHLVSAILVAKGDKKAIIRTLHAIFEQKFIREVIIINTDTSHTMATCLKEMTALYPRCFVVPLEEEMSLAKAYNLGARYASTQYLLFVDPRYEFVPNTMVRLLATGFFKPHSWIVGVAHPVQKSHMFRKMLGFYSRGAYSPAAIRTDFNSGTETDHVPEVTLAGGGFHVSNIRSECMLMPTRTFSELKGMDVNCSPEMLAVDLCFRLHLIGGSVYAVKELESENVENKMHLTLLSTKELLKQEWLTFKGRCYFYKKYVRQKTNFFFSSFYFGLLGLQFLGSCLYNTLLRLPIAFKRVS